MRKKEPVSAFRKLRIFVLVVVLLFVGADAILSKLRSQDWDRPLWVVVYPINADGSEVAQRYISQLTTGTFEPIGSFLRREISRYGHAPRTLLKFKLHPPVLEKPPVPPIDRNIVKIMWWSLALRYWAYRVHELDDKLPDDIRMFVLYHDPAAHDQLDHSLGLKEGLIGVVNAYSSRGLGARNNVVIAHELFHTVGATDKYDPANGRPVYPDGYAEPRRVPLYPQTTAEIMGGRIALSKHEAEMPPGLDYAVVGPITAREIGWQKK